MRYMLLIYSDEKHYETMSEADIGELMAGYGRFSAEHAGEILGSDRLQPAQTATTVRVRNGDAISTDGPFAETKEQLGGYYLVEAEDLDQAIALAAQIPTAGYGSVEVRPVWEME